MHHRGMQKRVLVAYASKHGSTREIAEVIAEQLSLHGLTGETASAERVDSIEPYAAVVLGSAVYANRWQAAATRFLKRHRDALGRRPLWIFTSGPLDPADDHDHTPARARRLAERAGAKGHATFGGRLSDAPTNFVERAMVRATPAEKRDARDWPAIRRWADEVARELVTVPAPAGR